MDKTKETINILADEITERIAKLNDMDIHASTTEYVYTLGELVSYVDMFRLQVTIMEGDK